jgi:hypothetical protein
VHNIIHTSLFFTKLAMETAATNGHCHAALGFELNRESFWGSVSGFRKVRNGKSGSH